MGKGNEIDSKYCMKEKCKGDHVGFFFLHFNAVLHTVHYTLIQYVYRLTEPPCDRLLGFQLVAQCIPWLSRWEREQANREDNATALDGGRNPSERPREEDIEAIGGRYDESPGDIL